MANGILRAVLSVWMETIRINSGAARSRRKTGRTRHCPNDVALASLYLVAASGVEVLEDRALLDGDPYGGGGMTPPPPAGGGTGGTTGGMMPGMFLGSVTGGVIRPSGQQWFETFGTDPLSGVVAVHRDLPGGLALSYASDAAVNLPIVSLDTTWSSATLPTGPLTATLRINGTTQSSVVIDHTGLQQGSPLRISLQATTPLPSGKYEATIEVIAPTSASSLTQTLTQTVLVEDRSTSAFGKGWNLTGLEKLVPQTGGNLLINGAGVREWFGSSGMPMPGMMANSALVQQPDFTWRLNLGDGGYHTFDTAGRLTSKVDSVGNAVGFVWDTATGLLISVTDPVGRATSLTYTNGRLSQVTDFAGRYVVLTHGTDGQLLTISSPSSFQVGPWIAPVMTYTYNASGLLATLSDTLQRSTSLTYSFAGRLASAVLPAGAAWNYVPAALVGLVNPTSGSGTAANPASRTLPENAIATWTNPLGGIRQLAVDGFGNIIRDVAPDGSQTTYTRDANGRVLSITHPDPDGSGPLPAPVTTSVYDTSGNMTLLTRPGGATQSWTYNAQNKPLTAVNELGQTTSYSWNSNRTLASVTLPNGAVTSYSDNARGQVTTVTIPDPDGSGPLTIATVTSIYDTYGRRTSQTNPDGTSKSWTYNALDQVTAATDELGRTTNYDYSWMGRVASVLLPDPDGTGPLPRPSVAYNFDMLGRTSSEFRNNVLLKTYAYNSAGQVASQTLVDPDETGPLTAATSTTSYDSLGQVLVQTAPGGASTNFTYDSLGHVLTVAAPDPDGSGPQLAAVTTFTFDGVGRSKTVTDALGGVTAVTYNAAGFQTGVTDALGHSSSATYNAAGAVLTSTDALNETTSFAYDVLGNVTSVTLPDPDGTGPLPAPEMTSTYDLLGRNVSSTAPDGGVSTIQYDVNGRLLRQTAADGSYLTVSYNPAGEVTGQTQTAAGSSAPSITTTVTYDNLGRMLSATDPGGTTSSTFDASGNVATVTDATGKTTSFTYDIWSRRTKTSDGLGNENTLYYNAAGQVGSVKDGLNQSTNYAYDNTGRLISSTDASNGITSYEYDRLGRSTRLVDALGNATSWTYDTVGQMLADTQVLAGGGAAIRSYAYDAVGKLTSRTDRNGRTITFEYDHLGRQTQQNWLSNGTSLNAIAMTYNAAMRVSAITDNDSAYAFTWDIMGRLLSANNAGTAYAPTVVLNSSYDALGRQSGLSASVNSIADFINTYSYDTASRMTQITQADGNTSAGSAIKDKRIDMTYDSVGRFTSITRYESQTTANLVAVSNYSYDSAGHLTNLQHVGYNGSVAQSSSIAGYSYAWDAADRLTSMNSVRDGLTTYSYDATSQLTGADHAGQADETYSYDANGNRVSSGLASSQSSYTIGNHNRTLSDGVFAYTYDAEGNQGSKTSIATGARTEYTWNHVNQLTSVTYKTGNDVVTKTVQYQYDALGRKIGKSVDDNGNGTMDRRESYIYDGAGLLADAAGSIHISGPNGMTGQAGWTDQLLFIFKDSDADGSAVATMDSRYLYGPAVDQVFAVEGASGELLWALSDHQGTPRDWAKRDSSNNTVIAQHTRYTAFGAIDSVADSSGNPISSFSLPPSSFTGQLYDADAGLIYYRARWYDPAIGKFINDDPMGFAAGDANVTRYVGNHTPTHSDPTGFDDIKFDIYDRVRLGHYDQPLHPSVLRPNTGGGVGPLHWTFTIAVFELPGQTDAIQIADQFYQEIRDFRHFNGGHNSVAVIDINNTGDVARFDTINIMSPFSDVINAQKVPVKLSFDDDRHTVIAQTLNGHMLDGIRKWTVVAHPYPDGVRVVVTTSAKERPFGYLNAWGGLLPFLGQDSQLKIWDQYFQNIVDAHQGQDSEIHHMHGTIYDKQTF